MANAIASPNRRTSPATPARSAFETAAARDTATTAGRDTTIAARRGPLALLERLALAVASMLVSINVCTGFPLLALWIGSRAASGNIFSWIGIITAIVSLAGLAALGVALLTRLSGRYDTVTGRPPPTRQPRPWELSMSAAPAAPIGRARRGTNPVEVIVVLTVVVAFVALEIWFFFFAGPVY